MSNTLQLILFGVLVSLALVLFTYLTLHPLLLHPHPRPEPKLQSEIDELVDRHFPKANAGEGTSLNWSIAPPLNSIYPGYNSSFNLTRWRVSTEIARRGDQLLLRHVREVVRCPLELVQLDPDFKWIHLLADIFMRSVKKSFKHRQQDLLRVPIVALGYRVFEGHGEGPRIGLSQLHLNEFLGDYCSEKFKFGKEVVCLALFDSQVSWLSNAINEQVHCFLNSTEVVALIVNQRHNIHHRKVFTFPLGVRDRKLIGFVQDMVKHGRVSKDCLVYSPTSLKYDR